VPQVKKWRISKVLARQQGYRPIEDEDVRYAFAAYRVGGLTAFPEGLDAETFKVEFKKLILSRYDAAWVLFAETKKGFWPVGLATGFWPHPAVETFLIFNNFVWFPWASPRNKIEAATNFFDKARYDVPMIGFAGERDKEFFALIAKLGVLRRVGTVAGIFGDEPSSVWQTRT
jgi:hypothetical protein